MCLKHKTEQKNENQNLVKKDTVIHWKEIMSICFLSQTNLCSVALSSVPPLLLRCGGHCTELNTAFLRYAQFLMKQWSGALRRQSDLSFYKKSVNQDCYSIEG